MGSLCCCFGGDSDEHRHVNQPSPETRRRQLAEAAENRLSSRGPSEEAARRQKRQDEADRINMEKGRDNTGLSWRVD
ncbi:hypothetical protein BOX15_Mlig033099g1 [Macrostomum lignano]|uniref:Small VCP/p97-interacting protein n=1 Tax=Macrostomum lignano TaxID=282301 RepID=A0A267E1X2_9PLAT|nr:hypothetical protein BOX15_Mlig033099g1 [Macrostomum lignano]